MKALFISDAHLRMPQDANYQRLLEFLDEQQDLDGLFLLGDIFELWIGYDHLVFAAYLPLLERLRRFSEQGTRLYFTEGNHDFLLGPYFRETLQCHIITEQQIISWDGQRLLLCHGDLVRPATGYKLLRGLWRSGFARCLMRVIHPDLVWRFGLWLSDKSLKKRPLNKEKDPSAWLRTFCEHQPEPFDLMICGHFHYPVTLQDQSPRIVALGDWQSRGAYLFLEDGRITSGTRTGSS
mgnify:CR=1 FL=1